MVYTVLIVDNEPVQRNLLTYSLQNRLGYRVVSASSVQEAVHFFYTDMNARPDLILHDLSSTMDAVRDPSFKMLCAYAPLVALVKYGDYDSALSAMNAGAQDFLTKPVAMERLSTSFRNLLQLRDACREVERLRKERFGATGLSGVSASPTLPTTSFSLLAEDGNMRRMEDIEADAIRFAMQYYHGRMTEVARKLGIGRSTLYRKLSGFGIRHEEAA